MKTHVLLFLVSGCKSTSGESKEDKIPTTDLKGAKPYLGTLKNRVHYGMVYGRHLRIWMLDESCARTEWVLKYDVDVGLYAHNLLLDINGRDLEGSWTVDEGNSSRVNDEYDGSNILIPADDKGKDEWDSDNDDIVTLEADDEDTFLRKVDIVGFHPSKKVVFFS
jgi:hypothetical protein